MRIPSLEPQRKINILCKNPLQKTPHIKKITSVPKLEKFAIMHGL